jgi:CRP/FNR family cyclic AMP-dependent transcriptional regulator
MFFPCAAHCRILAISTSPGFLALPEDVAARLLAASQLRKLVRGEQLFAAGSMPDAMFGVVSGAMRTSITSAAGREFVVGLLEPGHWFGEVSLLDGLPRTYTAQAVGECEVAVLPAPSFWPLLQSEPQVHLALTRLVCHRLRLALSWIDDSVLLPLPARLARRITALLQAGGASAAEGIVPLPQEDLAAQLGVSRQSVNRQLKLWEKEGVVRVAYGRITALDPAALLRLAAWL